MHTMRPFILLAAIGLFALSDMARAGDVTITQLNKKFDKDEITVKKGQTVTFLNSDAFTHNVYSETPGMAFDLKTQPPGKSSDVTFDKVGEALIECAIHPSMKMKVKVVDK